MMRRSFLLCIFVLVGSLVLLTACGGESTNTSVNENGNESNVGENDDQNAGEGASSGDDTLTIALGADMITFDIHDHNNTSTEAIHINMFDYLFQRDNDGEVHPHLVEEYENVDDTTWRFTLKEGVQFHNGDPFTADDVKFTLERVAEDESLQEHNQYNQIESVEVIDELEFEIHTHEPEPALLNRLARLGSGMLPKDYIEEEGWEAFLSEPVGTGPYQFVEWVRDDRIVLERFDDYYGEETGDWEELVFRVMPENSTRVGELLTGGVDIAVDVPPNEWDRINDNEGTSVRQEPSNRVMLLLTRQEDGLATADHRVREAIDYAINNEALTEQVLQGAGTPVQTRVTPGNIGYHPDLFDNYRYDPDQARVLLEEAGYGDGLEITLNSPQGRYMLDSDIAEMIAGMLAEVGITVNVEFLEWSTFSDRRNAGENDELMLIGFGNSLFDGALALTNFHSESIPEQLFYANDEVDRLYEEALVNMDEDERATQLQEIQEIVAEELPYIYLYQLDNAVGASDRIEFEVRLDEMFIATDIKKN